MNEEYELLTQKATAELERFHYAKSTVDRYQLCWSRFKDYAVNKGITKFDNDVLEQYFQDTFDCSYMHPVAPVPRNISGYHRALNVLAQVKETGVFYKRRPSKDHTIDERYQPAAGEFMMVKCAPLAATSKRQMRTHMESFLGFLSANEVYDYNKITKNIILSFWDTRSKVTKGTRMYDSYFLHKFFDFLYENGYTVVDNSVFVPKVKGSNKGQIPSYYTVDELTTLLACVDRSSPIGKRDYALLLFAVRYGPRVEDIRNLKLNEIDWDKSVISYVQEKSGKRITLKLYDDVATAFIDYFKNGRPETECRNVFVRHNAPFNQFGSEDNLHYIISKYMRFAGFNDFHHRKRGLYSMRHSIAGNLLNEGTPMPTVSEVLNHSKTDTTMHYTKIAVEQMKSCALEVD